MGVTGAAFWALSWVEFEAAVEGFSEFHGGGSGVKPPTREEAEELIKRADAMLKKQGKL